MYIYTHTHTHTHTYIYIYVYNQYEKRNYRRIISDVYLQMEILTAISLLALLLFIAYIIYPGTERNRLARRLERISGPRVYPVIGNIAELMVPHNRTCLQYVGHPS